MLLFYLYVNLPLAGMLRIKCGTPRSNNKYNIFTNYTSNLTTIEVCVSFDNLTGLANLPTTNNSLLSLYKPTVVRFDV